MGYYICTNHSKHTEKYKDFLLDGWLLFSASGIICQKLEEVWGLYD